MKRIIQVYIYTFFIRNSFCHVKKIARSRRSRMRFSPSTCTRRISVTACCTAVTMTKAATWCCSSSRKIRWTSACLRGHQCRGRWIRAFSADLEDHGLMRVQRLVYGYIWKVDVIDKLTPILVYNINEFIRLICTELITGGSGSLADSRNDCRFFASASPRRTYLSIYI